MRPLATTDCHDVPRLIDELVPGFAAVIDDVVVGCEDPDGEPVVAHELPDVLDRVGSGAFGRQRDDADIGGNIELAGGVPARLIHQHDRVGIRRDGERYLGKVQCHGFGIAEGQDEPCALALFGADRAEDVGRFRPLVFRCRGARPASGPAPRDLVLLTNAGFVLEPYLYGRALRDACPDLCQLGGEAPFLNASMACSFCAWWRGRAVSFT